MGDLQVSPPSHKKNNHDLQTTMNAEVVEKNGNLEGVVQVDVEEVGATYDVVWRRHGRQLNVPGYRPGKAPRAMLERRHGRRIQGLVTTTLMDDYYRRIAESIPGSVGANPKFFYDKPATFGESFEFSFVIPKPESFSLGDGSNGKSSGRATGEGVFSRHTFNTDAFVKIIEPPELGRVGLKRLIIDVSDREIEERLEEYRRSWKMTDDEIAQRLKLSSPAELPSYLKEELREKCSELAKDFMREQVTAIVVASSTIVLDGRRIEVVDFAKTSKDDKSQLEFMSFTTVAVFFKIAELEGMEKEIADAKNNIIAIDGFISLVADRVIEKATIEEVHFESWAKAEEFIRRSVDQ